MSKLGDFVGGGSNGIHKRELFTADGAWTKPANVLNGIVWVTMIAGGGEGQSEDNPSLRYGGNAGEAVSRFPLDVSAVTSPVTVTVGAGADSGSSTAAGPSSFGAFLSVSGANGVYHDQLTGGDFPSRPESGTTYGYSGGGGLVLGSDGVAYGSGGRGRVLSTGRASEPGIGGAVLVEWLEKV